MTTITRGKIKSTNKSPEIVRFIEFLNSRNLKPADIAASTNTAERTITKYIWEDIPLGGQLLRELLTVYGVSIDWVLTGRGGMYIDDMDDHPIIRGENRLIERKQYLDNETVQDVYLIFASVIEQSLVDAGAEAGKDYTYMDLYKLAQPHVIEESKKTELKAQIFTQSDRS
jgi:hypothetical protein